MIRYIILFGLASFLLLSCSQDERLDYVPESDSDMVSAVFELSMNQGLETGSDYEPMTKSFVGVNTGTRVIISNTYRAYIIKEVGTKWIVDKILTIKIDPNDKFDLKTHQIKANTTFHSFSTDLRPGKYRMTIFTGEKSINWNDNNLKVGTIVEDSSNPSIKTPWACTYKPVGTGGYIFEGYRSLQEEIFTNNIPFVIEKTEDLHSSAKPNTFPVSLHRMVTKLRILLQCDEEAGKDDFHPEEPNAITAELQTRNGKTFCAGLDVWGKPYYENPLYGIKDGEGEYITNLKFIVNCWEAPEAPLLADNGFGYIMGMKDGARQYAPFYFSDPDNTEIPVTLSEVEVSGSSNFYMRYVYAYPNAGAFEAGVDMILKHNSIYGIVFTPGRSVWNDPRTSSYECHDMILETDNSGVPVDARTIFDDFYEYRVRKVQP